MLVGRQSLHIESQQNQTTIAYIYVENTDRDKGD